MDKLSDAARAGVYLAEREFHYSRSLGQNFLLNDEANREIAEYSGACTGMNVLEIGPGAGTLTLALARTGARVLAAEIDTTLAPVLEKMLEGVKNVSIEFCDITKKDIPAMIDGHFGKDEPYSVISNLPYAIAAELLPALASSARPPESITALVQTEAAERMASAPGEKTWCAMAARIRYFCDIKLLMTLPPHMFTPNAHVDSTLIRLDRLAPVEREAQPKDEKTFLKCVDAAFAMRRKTLANNLSAAFALSKAEASGIIECAGISASVRGEVLTLSEICRVADILYDMRKGESV